MAYKYTWTLLTNDLADAKALRRLCEEKFLPIDQDKICFATGRDKHGNPVCGAFIRSKPGLKISKDDAAIYASRLLSAGLEARKLKEDISYLDAQRDWVFWLGYSLEETEKAIG